MNSYPGLQEAIRKLVHQRPNHEFSSQDVHKSFHGKPIAIVTYHLHELRKKGIVESTRRGFFRAAVSKTAIDIEAVRKHVAAQPMSVVVGEAWKHGTVNAIVPAEIKWVRFIEMHVASIKQRMASSAPASDVFTDADRELLDRLLEDVTAQARSNMPKK